MISIAVDGCSQSTYVVLPVVLQNLVVVQSQLEHRQSKSTYCNEVDSRGPPGGPPLPGNPGGGAPPGNPPGGNPPNPPGGAGPPTPAAGPPNPTGKPLPAGLLIPGPACMAVAAAPPGALVPNLADGSDGGGPSTELDTIFVPRRMISPRVRFSSASTIGAEVAPGALLFVAFRFTRRNSSVSARTIFMC